MQTRRQVTATREQVCVFDGPMRGCGFGRTQGKQRLDEEKMEEDGRRWLWSDTLLPGRLDALAPFQDFICVAVETQKVLSFRFTAGGTEAQTYTGKEKKKKKNTGFGVYYVFFFFFLV
jgi:ClpP class serine protease